MKSAYRFSARRWVALAAILGGGLLPGTCMIRSKQALVDGSKSFLANVLLNPNNIPVASQAAAAAAMRDQDHMLGVVARTAVLRDRFAEQMRALGLTVPVSHTNFVLLRFASAEVARRADAALRANHLLMRGMGGYGLPDCLRATICAPEIMDRAHDVLKGVLR